MKYKNRTLRKPSLKAIAARDLWMSETKWQGSVYDATFAFAKILGDPYSPGRELIINTDNLEVMRRLDLILGPHGPTILKVLILQSEKDE